VFVRVQLEKNQKMKIGNLRRDLYKLYLCNEERLPDFSVRRDVRLMMLSPWTGGLMIANELTTKTEFLTLTFGLTEGWWMYDDQQWRMPGAQAETGWRPDRVSSVGNTARCNKHTKAYLSNYTAGACLSNLTSDQPPLSGARTCSKAYQTATSSRSYDTIFCSLNVVAGSPLISRRSWVALLEAQGFHSVTVAGEAAAPPPLLARQSVVVGVSDGVVRLGDGTQPRAAAPSGTRAAVPAMLLHTSTQADILLVCQAEL
jgi:hypothetical protein